MLKRFTLVLILVIFFAGFEGFVVTGQTQDAELPPLTELGPYGVGIKVLELVDEQRENWAIETYVWFPADPEQGRHMNPVSPLLMGAVPDQSGAPYPLIIYSHGWMSDSAEVSTVMEYLASQGYIVAAATHHDTSPNRFELVDRPLDVMLVLNELAAITEGDLAGLIDSNNVGVMGYSQGADAAVQLVGLLADPVNYASWCAEHPDLEAYDCNSSESTWGHYTLVPWDFAAIDAYREQSGLQNNPDGSWAPFGDERIQAVLALAPCDFPLTTEDMLTAVTTPAMILHDAVDTTCDYVGNAVRTYAGLGTDDRYLVTSVGLGHGVFTILMNYPLHFAQAFFGVYLKGDEAYRPYLTPEGLPDWDSPPLVWGVYEG